MVVVAINTIACTKAVDRVDLVEQNIQFLDSATNKKIENVVVQLNNQTIGGIDMLAFMLTTEFIDADGNKGKQKIGTTSIDSIVLNILSQNDTQVTLSFVNPSYQTVSVPVKIQNGKFALGDSVWFSSQYIPGTVKFMMNQIKGEWLPRRKQINIYMNAK